MKIIRWLSKELLRLRIRYHLESAKAFSRRIDSGRVSGDSVMYLYDCMITHHDKAMSLFDRLEDSK